ncbi:MAG: DNA recombination protein RmuC, partial [Candidatus Roizmanbacteria bacterium]
GMTFSFRYTMTLTFRSDKKPSTYYNKLKAINYKMFNLLNDRSPMCYTNFMELFVIIIVSILSLVSIFFILYKLRGLEQNKMSPEMMQWLQQINQRLDQTQVTLDNKLTQNLNMFHNRLDKTAEVMQQVNQSIGQFSEIGRSMQELQQFLQSPKLRGNIGEQILTDLLTQHFPHQTFATQYTFKSGEKVDAVIKTSQGLIPIDAKFPIDNFRKLIQASNEPEKIQAKKDFTRDVKKHIQDISKKYILAQEGTVDYALMYIPSESVYYEIINDPELFDFAGSLRILPVSPLSFYAYMKAILMSFEGQRIQEQAKEILKILQALRKDYDKTAESFSILNKHITNAYNQSNQVSKQLTTIEQRLESTKSLSSPSDEKLIE